MDEALDNFFNVFRLINEHRDLFRLINEHRAVPVDREAPRHGHIWRKRVGLYALEDCNGIIEQPFPMRVMVVAVWRT